MKPVLHESKIHGKFWVIYFIIFLLCTIGIGLVLYFQYYQDEKVEIVFGITGSDSEEQDKYNDLKADFKKNEDNITLNVEIPYININNDITKKMDQEIRAEYKEKAENLLRQNSMINVVYSVEYKAYIQNNILSLVIR